MGIQITSLRPKMVPKTTNLNTITFSETRRVLEPPPSTWRSLSENCEKKNDYRNIFHTILFIYGSIVISKGWNAATQICNDT